MDQPPSSKRPRISAIWRWAMPLLSITACGLFGLGVYLMRRYGDIFGVLWLLSAMLSLLIGTLTISQWGHFSRWLRIVALLGLLPLAALAWQYNLFDI